MKSDWKKFFPEHLENEKNSNYDMNISAIYNTKSDWGAQYRAPTTLQNFNGSNGSNPNGLTKKQELMVRSAIKYWVERHKHVVRWVTVRWTLSNFNKLITQTFTHQKPRRGYRRHIRFGFAASHVNIHDYAHAVGLPGHKDRRCQCLRIQCVGLLGICIGAGVLVLHLRKPIDWRGEKIILKILNLNSFDLS